MPTRIGYGPSQGPDLESSGKSGDTADYGAGFTVAADEVQQVLQWLSRRGDVDSDHVVLAGVSYGGAVSIALAARNPKGVVAVINFSGGNGGNKSRRPRSPCHPERIGDLFAEYGSTAHVPSLWLYAVNDMLWGTEVPKDWFARYRVSGAPATFVKTSAVGADGHQLMTRGLDLWHEEVRRFLAEHH